MGLFLSTPGETPVPLNHPALPLSTDPNILNTMPHPPEHKLRWYQYKLSSLFILTTLVAIACSWYPNEMHNAAKRRAAL